MWRALSVASVVLLLAGCAHQIPKAMNVKMERVTRKPVAAPAKPAPKAAVPVAAQAKPAAPNVTAPAAKPAERQEQPTKKHWYDRFFRKSAPQK